MDQVPVISAYLATVLPPLRHQSAIFAAPAVHLAYPLVPVDATSVSPVLELSIQRITKPAEGVMLTVPQPALHREQENVTLNATLDTA